MSLYEGEVELCVGSVCYYPARGLMTGPEGEARITAQASRVAERLLRRPGMTIETGALVDAMYGQARDKAPTADVVLRVRIKMLRDAIAAVGGVDVRIRHERRLGYVIEVVAS